ncbi:MAG: Oligopeptide transport ATP-binding protein OppD [Thermocaproicibacter melissae]|jgi:peptide/nickel transport system ATP-binding protein|uniref:ABC transporter ATP-binding protein n=1 Tax=Thermocaproicibacter melissae TaxID=2966552 RepID=UPI0024B25782|nr:ABC transporter ATP-binding protein [Thermocaproicibacter melissae]WBY63995.1 ABC transporter ATP-binding protein [Thermocaproicibacter melissae]
MLLEVKNLTTEFKVKHGTVRAVNNLSFHVNEGEILAIVGESGSGKSVTSLSIMGLLPPNGKVTGGEILYRGEDLLKKSESEMRAIKGDKISMIFQEPMTSLNPVYRIKDQIMESILTHNSKMTKKEALQHTIEMLRTVGIPSPEERAYDYPHEMSGGMRQRVMIAMALACQPDLLIADEPTTALDVTIQAQILELLYEMREKFNMSVMLITHDLGVVAEAADRVIVMYCGQIVESAEVKSLFANPMHPYTLGLLKSIPRLEDESKEPLYMIKGMVPNPLHMPQGCPFSDRCDRCMEICRKKKPELRQVGDHMVRCFLYESGEETK